MRKRTRGKKSVTRGPDGRAHVSITHGADEPLFSTEPVLRADGRVDVDASMERYRQDLSEHDGPLFRLLLLTKGGKEMRRLQLDAARRGWEQEQ